MLCAALGLVLLGLQNKDTLPQENQASERSRPFSYFLVPSDAIGFKDSPEGFQITYDGAIRAADLEMRFYGGKQVDTLIASRVKTLVNEHMPIVRFQREIDGITYKVESFAAPYNLDPLENLVAFIKVEATFTGDGGGRESGIKFVVDKGEGREGRTSLGAQAWFRNKFAKKAVSAFDRLIYQENGAWTTDGHVVFASKDIRNTDGMRVISTRGNPATFIVKIPFIPIDQSNTAEVEKLLAMDYFDYRQDTLNFWNDVHREAMEIDVPDKKVVDTLRSSLTYMLMARDKTADGKFIQKVNEFQYDHFFPRDTAYFCRTYGMLGLTKVQRESLDHFLVKDAKGNVTAFLRDHPDDWGQSVWACSAYWRTTGDNAFAKSLIPAIRKHMVEFREKTKADPLGLWPVAPPYDNEALTGHYTGHNLYALLGMQEMIDMCRAVGENALANEIEADRAPFKKVVMDRIALLANQAEGFMPPGMDSPELGYDWTNASAGIYPFEVYRPGDPMAEATLRMIREYKYREGIMTYGPNAWAVKKSGREGEEKQPGFLHHYETFYLDQALLASGYQQEVVEDLYSVLAHTSSTNAGFEFSIVPWSNRDPGGNLTPHGWFAARYIELVRNMLVREHEGNLHLCSALSPKWVREGEQVAIRRSATYFGRADFEMNTGKDGAVWNFDFDLPRPSKKVFVHMPWFVEAKSAKVDGRTVAITGGMVEVPATAKQLEVTWTWKKDRPDLSYEKAVDLWLKKNYSDAKLTDPAFLFPHPTRPTVSGTRLFLNRQDVEIKASGGKIYYTTDGTLPTSRSTEYRRAIRIENNTTLTAITIWPDGRQSEPTVARFEKAVMQPATAVASRKAGLSYSYYEAALTTFKTFDFATAKPVKEGVAELPDLDGIGYREDNFVIRYSGYIDVPQTGIYSFRLGSDDGSQLKINGRMVIDNDGPHPFTMMNGAVALEKGMHKIEVLFFEAGDAQRLTVEMGVDGKGLLPLDPRRLFH